MFSQGLLKCLPVCKRLITMELTPPLSHLGHVFHNGARPGINELVDFAHSLC